MLYIELFWLLNSIEFFSHPLNRLIVEIKGFDTSLQLGKLNNSKVQRNQNDK